MDGDKNNLKKRKRTKNTSHEQYEIYVNLLESDYVFRSGTFDPTLGENYVQNKWQDLSTLLNSMDGGPHLSVDDWKKRFADWKYAIRAKYRKIVEHRNKTGSGPQSDIKLSPLEERALSAWGKVVVTGTPFVSNYDGVNLLSDEELLPSDVNMDSIVKEASIILVNDASDSSTFIENDMLPTTPTERTRFTEVLTTATNVAKKRNRMRPKPLSLLTEKLLESNTKNESMHKELNDTIKTFCEEYIKAKTEKLELETKKVNFEIAKYQYENPNFVFHHK